MLCQWTHVSLLISEDVFITGCQVQLSFLFAISVCTDQTANSSFMLVLEVFIGRNTQYLCIVLSDPGMQISNTETWKSVN